MHVPAPNNVTTAAVADPADVVRSPATEHTVGVDDVNATTKFEDAVAVMRKAASPKVLVLSELNVID